MRNNNSAVKSTSLVLSFSFVMIAFGTFPIETSGQAAETQSVRPLLWHSRLPRSPENVVNIYRRFDESLREAMVEFYGTVLGMEPLPYTESSMMIRLPLGTGELKLFPSRSPNELRASAVDEAIGVRLMTLFFPDEDALTARFIEHGYAAPEFRSTDERQRIAHVQDPDGQWVELLVISGAPPSTYQQLEFGLTVGNLEQSRAHYRDFLGLEELPPVDHPLLGVTKYPYRHDDQIISLWTFTADLPKDLDTAGIQYVVWNVEAVVPVASAHGVEADRPLSEAGRYPRTAWFVDPDGITNYFAQFHDSPEVVSSN